MSDAEQDGQGEPTMEEILASIRRIISEDAPEDGKEAEAADESGEAAETPPVEEPEEPPVEEPAAEVPVEAEEPDETEEEDDEDVLELTQMVGEDGTVVDLNAQRQAREEPESPAEEDEVPEIELAEPDPEPESPAPPEDPADSLLSDPSRDAAAASLTSLMATADAQNRAMTTIGGDRTLEVLVRETLEPHLKNWLDANLPVLVERIVREEIQKMVKRAEYR